MGRMIELAALNPYIIYLANEENGCKVRVPSGIGYFEKGLLAVWGRSILNVNIVGNQFTGEVVLSFSPIKGT